MLYIYVRGSFSNIQDCLIGKILCFSSDFVLWGALLSRLSQPRRSAWGCLSANWIIQHLLLQTKGIPDQRSPESPRPFSAAPCLHLPTHLSAQIHSSTGRGLLPGSRGQKAQQRPEALKEFCVEPPSGGCDKNTSEVPLTKSQWLPAEHKPRRKEMRWGRGQGRGGGREDVLASEGKTIRER